MNIYWNYNTAHVLFKSFEELTRGLKTDLQFNYFQYDLIYNVKLMRNLSIVCTIFASSNVLLFTMIYHISIVYYFPMIWCLLIACFTINFVRNRNYIKDKFCNDSLLLFFHKSHDEVPTLETLRKTASTKPSDTCTDTNKIDKSSTKQRYTDEKDLVVYVENIDKDKIIITKDKIINNRAKYHNTLINMENYIEINELKLNTNASTESLPANFYNNTKTDSKFINKIISHSDDFVMKNIKPKSPTSKADTINNAINVNKPAKISLIVRSQNKSPSKMSSPKKPNKALILLGLEAPEPSASPIVHTNELSNNQSFNTPNTNTDFYEWYNMTSASPCTPISAPTTPRPSRTSATYGKRYSGSINSISPAGDLIGFVQRQKSEQSITNDIFKKTNQLQLPIKAKIPNFIGNIRSSSNPLLEKKKKDITEDLSYDFNMLDVETPTIGHDRLMVPNMFLEKTNSVPTL
eukprot:254713_1